jgi:hypothetical protein
MPTPPVSSAIIRVRQSPAAWFRPPLYVVRACASSRRWRPGFRRASARGCRSLRQHGPADRAATRRIGKFQQRFVLRERLRSDGWPLDVLASPARWSRGMLTGRCGDRLPAAGRRGIKPKPEDFSQHCRARLAAKALADGDSRRTSRPQSLQQFDLFGRPRFASHDERLHSAALAAAGSQRVKNGKAPRAVTEYEHSLLIRDRQVTILEASCPTLNW